MLRLQLCRPCEAADAPGAVKVVWQLVNEHTLMEAERAMLKLLRGLDKHLQHVRQAAAATPAADSAPQPATAESLTADGAQARPSDGDASRSNNSVLGLQVALANQQSDAGLTPAEPATWNNPIAELAGNTGYSWQQQGGENGVTGSDPDRRPQLVSSANSHLAGAEANSPSSQAMSRGPSVGQTPDQATVIQSARPSQDQLTRRCTGDARGLMGDTRRVTGDARRITEDARRITRDAGTQQVTIDMQQPLVGDSPPPADRPVSLRYAASSRKEKLEYRLSHDDVYSPTPEEVQALLQQDLLNTQQQQQLSSYGVTAASDVASNMQSSLNGMSEGGASVAVSVFANPSVISGLSGSQAGAYMQQEEPNMLSLIAKVQSVQVRLYCFVEHC